MKKDVILSISFLGILLFGCTQTGPDKPYITNVNPDRSFGIAGDTINFAVTVSNPIKIDYNGNILIKADSPNCFGMGYVTVGSLTNIQGYLTPISVVAGATNSALITMRIPTNNALACYQPSNHKINIFLLQNDNVLDTKDSDFALFERR